MPLHYLTHGGKVVDIASQHLEPRIAPHMSSYRRVVLRVMQLRPPDDPLRDPRRRVLSLSRAADVMLGPERPRHSVTQMTSGPARSRSPIAMIP